MDALAGFREAGNEAISTLGNGVGYSRRRRIDAIADGVGADLQLLFDGFGAIIDGRVEEFGRIKQAGRDGFARLRQFLDEAFTLHAERGDHLLAGRAQLIGDVVRMAAEQNVHVNACLIDLFGDARSRLRDFAGNHFLRAGDRLAHAVRIGDDGLALGGEFVDEGAHAPLVVRIGAFEVGDFVMHHQFEFAGARQSALDAIAHGGDLAANRLRENHHLLGGEAVGVGKPDRHFTHGARRMAHFLNPLGQGGDHEEESDGANGGQSEHRRRGLVIRSASCAKGIDAHHGEPADRQTCGDDLCGAARAVLQRLEDLADRAAVVVGGT